MRTRHATLALVSTILLAACDAGITGPSTDRLSSLSLAGPFACGLDDAGRAYCWGGDNNAGQLGNGTNRPSPTPVRVNTGVRFQEVVSGATHACGLAADGRVFCWGDNTSSQLGVATTDLDCHLLRPDGWMQDFGNACSTVPAPVETPLRFAEIGAAGDRTCGRTSGGAIWCWGTALFGMGDSALTGRSDSLIRVSSSASFATLAVGQYHTCASDVSGQGYCWGYESEGVLGRGVAGGSLGNPAVPGPINSSAFIKRWALGRAHTCALTGAGGALCWGSGSSGQRGDSSTTATQPDPTFVTGGRGFSRIAAAGDRTCALEAGTGTAWCWGENSDGQLGIGTTTDQASPGRVLGGLSFSRLVMGAADYPDPGRICGISTGGVYCWGLLPRPLNFGE